MSKAASVPSSDKVYALAAPIDAGHVPVALLERTE